MCLAIPAQVMKKMASDMAVVEIAGVRREASLALVDAGIGDYVLLHAGIAIAVMDRVEAEKTLVLIHGGVL
jgi:hydrogenase expression/formation protein HypC